ncbi:MAG TPA: VTT domain-containing protein [Candidatus Angelobacter sp.]|nr:VTT domain-containing protein [Candidatus Angelobacter sp.]
MKELFHLLTSHPYLVVLLSAILERVGLPLFLSPVLVGAGALAAANQMRFDVAFWVALLACIAGDSLWYEMGRKKGDSVLALLCRISFEPDTCVRKSKVFFEKGAHRTLFFSKWLPGVSHIIPAVAGLSQVGRQQFQVTNVAGSALWVLALMLMGYIPVEHLHLMPAMGSLVFEGALVLLAANVVIKYTQRRSFLKDLYKSRISPQNLHEMLDSGQGVVIVDLRHSLDSITDPRVLPGAIRMLPEDVTERAHTLPPDREIVLYCT